jgi:hypothetical protein
MAILAAARMRRNPLDSRKCPQIRKRGGVVLADKGIGFLGKDDPLKINLALRNGRWCGSSGERVF